jgi:hypothetical protein
MKDLSRLYGGQGGKGSPGSGGGGRAVQLKRAMLAGDDGLVARVNLSVLVARRMQGRDG